MVLRKTKDILFRPFRFLRDRMIASVKKRALVRESIRVIMGMSIYRRLQKQFGASTHIICIRGATGDVYLQFLLLDEYLRQKGIKEFAIIGDGGGLIRLAALFGLSNVKFVQTRDLERMEKAYLFGGGQWDNIIIPFCWSNNFSAINQCRLRMTDKFNFMDTYYYFSYGIKPPVQYRMPNFPEIKEQQIFGWESIGIVKDRTVMISPDANSVTALPVWFWNGIIKQLQQRGYTVFMNCNYFTYFRAQNFFPAYADCVPLLEYAGYFIGVRSGFCDIISSAKCRKVILYPAKQKKPNYSFHRTELEFSGLEVMDLYHGEDLTEISTPLIKNITDKDLRLSGTKDYFSAMELLHKQILEIFE